MDLQHILNHTLTKYDESQQKKRGYNIHALPQYLERVQNVVDDIEAGADPRQAIIAGFSGILQRKCLKAAGFAPAEETAGGPLFYQPVKLKA